jgi:hypothetical protein
MRGMLAIGFVALAAPVAVAAGIAEWKRYSNDRIGLSAEFPAQPEYFDKYSDYAKGVVVQLTWDEEDAQRNFKALYFLQHVQLPQSRAYDADAILKAASADSGDSAVSIRVVKVTPLRPAQMPLAGMKGVEVVRRLSSGFFDGDQIEVSRTMVKDGQRVDISLRYFEKDRSQNLQRFLNSLRLRG